MFWIVELAIVSVCLVLLSIYINARRKMQLERSAWQDYSDAVAALQVQCDKITAGVEDTEECQKIYSIAMHVMYLDDPPVYEMNHHIQELRALFLRQSIYNEDFDFIVDQVDIYRQIWEKLNNDYLGEAE